MKQVFAVIKPNSRRREGVIEGEGGALVVYTKEPAIEGRANAAAIKLIAEHFEVNRMSVKLIRGHASKYKVFEISE